MKQKKLNHFFVQITFYSVLSYLTKVRLGQLGQGHKTVNNVLMNNVTTKNTSLLKGLI